MTSLKDKNFQKTYRGRRYGPAFLNWVDQVVEVFITGKLAQ
jgi:hypothetical protein